MYGLVLTLQQKLIGLAIFVVWSLGCFSGGYLYRWHVDSVKDAGRQATATTAQVTANAGAAASDTVTIASLQSQLSSANAWAASLQTRIKDAQNAKAPDVACRMPDGVREAINANLSTRTK